MLRMHALGVAVAAFSLAGPALADSPTRLQEARAAAPGAQNGLSCGHVALNRDEVAHLNDTPTGSRSIAARHAAIPCAMAPSRKGYADGSSVRRASPAPYW